MDNACAAPATMRRDADIDLCSSSPIGHRPPNHEIDRLKWVGSLVRAALIGNDDAACLLWVDASDSVRIRVLEGPLTVGCDSTCDLVLPLHSVAGHHCHVVRSADGVRIRDLGTKEGTRLNGESLGPDHRFLSDGDIIEVGRVPVAFVGESEVKVEQEARKPADD